MQPFKDYDNNYPNGDEKLPKNPMGFGSFAGLPEEAIMKNFNQGTSYRGGIMNNPAYGIDEDSNVDENGCR